MEEWARSAVRLHPVQGTPVVSDSHIGGSMLCSLEHADEETDHFGPCVRLVWRSSAVTDVLAAPPEPAVFEPQYRTRPCVLRPYRIVEYPIKLHVD